MASEFEPVVRTEETPEARIVIVEVPGFRKEDLKVEIGNQGNLIISGKRGVKEMEEMTKVGGRLEKMLRFRKVISTPENLNTDGRITAKFRDEALRISLPLLHIPDQQSQAEALPGNEKPDQSVQSKVKSSSPARQQDSMQEQSGVAQDNQRARHPDAIKQDDEKTKASAAVEESKGLVAERKTEAPKLAQDFVHEEPPISKDAQELSAEAGIGDQSQFIQSKSKQEEEECVCIGRIYDAQATISLLCSRPLCLTLASRISTRALICSREISTRDLIGKTFDTRSQFDFNIYV